MLHLRNPHSVLAVFETRAEDVIEIRVHGPTATGAWKEVIRLAEAHRVPVLSEAGSNGGRRGKRKQSHAAVGRAPSTEAVVGERAEMPLEQLLAGVSGPEGPPGLWLALDQLHDPHNVGAVFRTGAFYGVRGMILTRDRSAPLTATVYDVASGGMEYVPFSQPPNLRRSLEAAKQAGLWVLGTSQHAERDVSRIDRDRSWLLVVGNEEKGLRRLTLEQCDEVCRLTPLGQVPSLNVSVAAGILMANLIARPDGP